MKKEEVRIVLASGSPRRREILKRAGLAFEVLPARGEERYTKVLPEEIVMELSRAKASEVYFRLMEGAFGQADGKQEEKPCAKRALLVVSADTVVAIDGRILGKPKDPEDAFSMLSRLQGRTHDVYTGVTLFLSPIAVDGKMKAYKEKVFHVRTGVEFKPMTEEEIRAYVATGEPLDKAGAYAIQGIGGRFVAAYHGDYDNIVGFPLEEALCEVDKLISEEE